MVYPPPLQPDAATPSMVLLVATGSKCFDAGSRVTVDFNSSIFYMMCLLGIRNRMLWDSQWITFLPLLYSRMMTHRASELLRRCDLSTQVAQFQRRQVESRVASLHLSCRRRCAKQVRSFVPSLDNCSAHEISASSTTRCPEPSMVFGVCGSSSLDSRRTWNAVVVAFNYSS